MDDRFLCEFLVLVYPYYDVFKLFDSSCKSIINIVFRIQQTDLNQSKIDAAFDDANLSQ